MLDIIYRSSIRNSTPLRYLPKLWYVIQGLLYVDTCFPWRLVHAFLLIRLRLLPCLLYKKYYTMRYGATYVPTWHKYIYIYIWCHKIACLFWLCFICLRHWFLPYVDRWDIKYIASTTKNVGGHAPEIHKSADNSADPRSRIWDQLGSGAWCEYVR